MTSNVLCRYYLQGACAFGDKCRFSHNKESDEPSQVCRYYLAGNCAYGDKCRYQHSKPGWSGRGQPAPASNYSAPAGVPKPPTGSGSMVKLPSGASEFGMVEAAVPNWDDYMTPDEMDEFEQWQAEQAMAAAGPGGRGSSSSQQQQQQQEGGGFGEDDNDIMDPADIPLCNEFAHTGGCSAGEECCYIHGDQCEICGYFCIHPYNPDITAHHQLICSEAMAAAAAAGGGMNGSKPNGTAAAVAPAAAAAAAGGSNGKNAAAAPAAAEAAAAAEEKEKEKAQAEEEESLQVADAADQLELSEVNGGSTLPAGSAADAGEEDEVQSAPAVAAAAAAPAKDTPDAAATPAPAAADDAKDSDEKAPAGDADAGQLAKELAAGAKISS